MSGGSPRVRAPLWAALGLLLVALAASPVASAHKPSDSYLSLAPAGERIEVRWDVALRDLDALLGLDLDDDGRLTWDEVRRRRVDIAAALFSGLRVARGASACTAPAATAVAPDLHLALATHSDGTYAALDFTLRCADVAAPLQVDYTLFASSDPTHRGIVTLRHAGPANAGVQGAVLGPERSRWAPARAGAGRWGTFVQFVGEGLRHIAGGYDHLLFLLTLLLPSVLVYGSSAAAPRWQGAPRLQPALWDVLRIVTAFTVAHSVTLTLAALDLVTLPSRWVEAAIAATVALSAVNNLRPVLYSKRWLAAFAFGLIHGFGFGQALKELGLPAGGLALSLLGFNVGVELGQLAVVAVFVPIAFLVRHTPAYRRGAVVGGSIAVALVSTLWFAERAWDLRLLEN